MDTAKPLQELKNLLGEDRVLTKIEDRACYSYDASPYISEPQAVLIPRDTRDISGILKIASKYKMPVIPRGAGTGLSGGCVPVDGVFVLDMSKLNKIIEIDTKNLVAVVQAGVVLADLHRAVESLGLFYPPDPQSMNICTIGGNIATNAGGPRCFKYGVTKDYVLGLEVVLADGRIIRTGGKTIKNVSGYDLTRLFTGSEGTLGVITEVILRLIPLPRAKRTALALFNTLEDGAAAVSGIIERRIVPTTLELMDQDNMILIEKAKGVGFPMDAEAGILIEVDGKPREVAEDINLIAEICKEFGAREVRIAQTPEEAAALWAGRKASFGCLAQSTPSVFIEDATVPRSQLVTAIREFKALAKKYNLRIPILGHAGDGNLHPDICFDEKKPDEVARVEQCIDEMFSIALKLGGTLSGEHGIGIAKRKYVPWEFGEAGADVLRSIKNALDPLHILNPGKVLL
ncbi:MAG: glcD1 [Peptococcaceae bacterium]|jgi:glycolate oxidase|nr:glcD1 [Peptococcaceae bacterium]